MSRCTADVTELRRDILEALDRYIFLSTPQAYRVIPKRGEGKHDTWERALRRALQLCEKAGYITHGPVYEERKNKRSGFAARRFVYYMTRRGAEKLAEKRSRITSAGIHIPKVPYYQRKPASLAHEVAITDFHIALREALRAHPHLVLHWLQRDIKKSANPDAIFGIQDTRKSKDQSTHWFFLEMELSRAGNWKGGESQKVRKARHYDAYRQTRAVSTDWPFMGDIRVVFAEETNERMMNLLAAFAKKLAVKFLWLTSRELVGERGILGQVFYTPKDFRERSNSLLDLMR